MAVGRPLLLSIGFLAILFLVLFLAFYVHSDDHTHNVSSRRQQPQSAQPSAHCSELTCAPPLRVTRGCSVREGRRGDVLVQQDRSLPQPSGDVQLLLPALLPANCAQGAQAGQRQPGRHPGGGRADGQRAGRALQGEPEADQDLRHAHRRGGAGGVHSGRAVPLLVPDVRGRAAHLGHGGRVHDGRDAQGRHGQPQHCAAGLQQGHAHPFRP